MGVEVFVEDEVAILGYTDYELEYTGVLDYGL